VHNLKSVDVTIPKNAMVVFCGVSGSGKSSLAFDTIFAEGQRRYVESLSAYARQFLGQVDKPDVDRIEGLSPAVSIDQKTTSHNPRSTVGTVTEVWDHLRLLYARAGNALCPGCGKEMAATSPGEVVDQLLNRLHGGDIMILAPVVRDRKGSQEQLWEELTRRGFSRVRVDGVLHRLSEVPALPRYESHRVEVVVDRLTVAPERRSRIVDAVETALDSSGGYVSAVMGGVEHRFSSHLACADCGTSREALEPRSFSFNSPYGACADCDGLGSSLEVSADLLVPDRSLTIREGAISPWTGTAADSHFITLLTAVLTRHGGDLDTPFSKLPKRTQRVILEGDQTLTIKVSFDGWGGDSRPYSTRYEGVRPWVRRRWQQSGDEGSRWAAYLQSVDCASCGGSRLRPEALTVHVGNRSISEISAMTVSTALEFFHGLQLHGRAAVIGAAVVKELLARLGFLDQVGLGYLTLARAASTLSGGEAQRIRLATQIGSGLTGVLYVLDEPSIGLHQRDNRRLLDTLTRLRDLGNTLIVVEHDEETIENADWVVDIGPGAGRHGGTVVYSGPPSGLTSEPGSLTGAYLSAKLSIPTPALRRPGNGKRLTVVGARENNLQDLDVEFPLGKFIAVSGVSGSGKSTLVNDILAAGLARRLNGSHSAVGAHRRIDGVDDVDKLVVVDQSPIGRTPRSNPATYTGLFDHIRTLFSQTELARTRGYGPGRFSFNVRGGRCEPCAGEGTTRVEMNFLPDVYVPCDRCGGARYNRETLEVTYKERTVADVLAMTVDEAVVFFESVPTLKRFLGTLAEVGLGYVALGQAATTLSGGEAQRVKLAAELHKRSTGRTVYVLDEPTTGLHFDDVAKLVKVLHRLTDAGNTVIVIEHDLDVLRVADHVIDLGPEGGPGGGSVVASGTPEEVATHEDSHTGRFLASALLRHPAVQRS
jgi:excinuclease ABC subunit A